MAPIRKRNTRSTTVLNNNDTGNATALMHSIEENIGKIFIQLQNSCSMTRCLDEQVFLKQTRTKRCSKNKKQSFDEQDADSSCMDTTRNSPSNLIVTCLKI